MKRIPDTASTYRPDPAMVRIADERTRAILREWTSALNWGPVDFRILAESCYMQGIHDVLDAIDQRGLVVRPIEPRDEWEGYCG